MEHGQCEPQRHRKHLRTERRCLHSYLWYASRQRSHPYHHQKRERQTANLLFLFGSRADALQQPLFRKRLCPLYGTGERGLRQCEYQRHLLAGKHRPLEGCFCRSERVERVRSTQLRGLSQHRLVRRSIRHRIFARAQPVCLRQFGESEIHAFLRLSRQSGSHEPLEPRLKYAENQFPYQPGSQDSEMDDRRHPSLRTKARLRDG